MQYFVHVQMYNLRESFQIVAKERSYAYRIYPDIDGAHPHASHKVLGPDGGGHGLNWTIGKSLRDSITEGVQYEIALACPSGGPLTLSWTNISGLKRTPNCTLDDSEEPPSGPGEPAAAAAPAEAAQERTAGVLPKQAAPKETATEATSMPSTLDVSPPPYGRCYMVGTWDDFEGTREMEWDATEKKYKAFFRLAEDMERFQILANGTSFERRFYPDVNGANPKIRHRVMGPDGGGHGFDWVLSRAATEKGEAAPTYEIVLSCPNEFSPTVSWTKVENKNGDDTTRKKGETSIKQVAQVAWEAEVAAEVSSNCHTTEEDTSKTSMPGSSLDVPPRSLAILEVERRRQLDAVEQKLTSYDRSPLFPRPEDEMHQCRDTYEMHLRNEALQTMRRRMADSIATNKAVKPKPIVLVALMAVHIASEARLKKLRDTLRSIEEQRLTAEDGDLVISISWHSPDAALREKLRKLLVEFQEHRSSSGGVPVLRPQPATDTGSKPRSRFQNFMNEQLQKAAFEKEASSNDWQRTLLTEQSEKLMQFEHIKAALATAEAEMSTWWTQDEAASHSIWCIFGDDDDLWHPERTSAFAKAIRNHRLADGVAAFVSVARADVRKPVAVGDARMDSSMLPRTASAVEDFLATSPFARRRSQEDIFKEFMKQRRQAQFEGKDPATVVVPLELEMEYFDFCPRLRILKEFFATTSARILSHRFCDLRLDEFLISYARLGKEMGLELSWFDPGSVWMYFYSCTGIDMDGTWQNIEGQPENEGSNTSMPATLGGDNSGHVSTTFPIRKAELVLAEELREQLQYHDEGLTPAKLAKYLASYRINLEVLMVRLHTRTLDQRTFDGLVFDCAMNSFGTFIEKVQKRSRDLKSRGAEKLFKVCQSFASMLAQSLDVKVFWHRPDEYLMPSLVLPDEQGLLMNRDGLYMQSEEGYFIHQEGFFVDQDGYIVGDEAESDPRPQAQPSMPLLGSNVGDSSKPLFTGGLSGYSGLPKKDPYLAGRGKGKDDSAGAFGQVRRGNTLAKQLGFGLSAAPLATKAGGEHSAAFAAGLGRGRGSAAGLGAGSLKSCS